MMAQGVGMGGHQSARMKDDSWLTPPHIIETLGPFDLDPCAPPVLPWRVAKAHIQPPQDGLSESWEGFVWCNPPYGRDTWRWLGKLAEHGDGIALTFARTETAGFFEQVWRKADALLFIEGRLYFHRADGQRASANAGAPSVLVAYGSRGTEKLRQARSLGQFIQLREN